MYLTEDAVLTAIKRLPPKFICSTYGVGIEDLIHALCGSKPSFQVSEDIKTILVRLESRGKITLLRMDVDLSLGPILGIQLNQEQ